MLVVRDEYGSVFELSRCPRCFLYARDDESTGTCARQGDFTRTPVTGNGWHSVIGFVKYTTTIVFS